MEYLSVGPASAHDGERYEVRLCETRITTIVVV